MDIRRRRILAAIALTSAALLTVAACGEEAPQVSTSTDGSGGDDTPPPAQDADRPGQAAADSPSADDLVATCGGIRFDELPADPSSFPPLGDDQADDIDLTIAEGEAEFFDIHDWYVASESDDELSLFGIPHDPVPEGPPYASASFDREGDSWVPSSWGQCRVSIDAAGWGNAHFVLDPDVEPDPEAERIAVQAWEVDCAGGQVPEGREVRPVVLSEDETTVEIVILVEPVTGDATCPSNPSFPLEIELGAPLGDRAVVDASVDPALERPWPPTESSQMSNGMDE
ncbi:hypothetical protein [Phytoactinopolyspora halotolerans]|uniref:Secreted protein n=1 Tax=Phytoactinopolyspora halotolerans TaxID=1981512 RepID=A0A6L9SHE7_9ACTN|nr:hypothetical protein [Phytoactinopolyspora halotolerans]NEE04676.1 hypothetical protein [Phytoactinopolyspora halotolerans]